MQTRHRSSRSNPGAVKATALPPLACCWTDTVHRHALHLDTSSTRSGENRRARLDNQVVLTDFSIANKATQGCDWLLRGIKLGLSTMITVLLADLVHLHHSQATVDTAAATVRVRGLAQARCANQEGKVTQIIQARNPLQHVRNTEP